MAANIEELLDLLYMEIEEAKAMTFNAEKCVIDRDKVLDMIDDVKAELPVELQKARELLAERNEYIASARREAESLRKHIEEEAHRLINREVIVRQAEEKADAILADAEDRAYAIQEAANEYCEETMRRMEEAVADAYDEVKHTRARFLSALGGSGSEPSRPSSRPQRRAVYDAEADRED